MSNKCPFCGKGNVIINSFFGKDDETPPNICLNCGYAWRLINMKPCPVVFRDGLAYQVEDWA